MIYSRFGETVKILPGSNLGKGIAQVQFTDGSIQALPIISLKADGAILEIIDAIVKANKELI